MARITRKQQKIFAESATNNGVFGSLQENNPTYSNDPDTIQGRPAYAQGWNGATYSSELLPPLEEFQALQYLFSRQIAYLLQDGVAEWNTTTPYYKGSIVKTISGTNIKLFRSLADNNTGNQTTDTSKWALIYDSQNPYANSNFDNITDFSKNISNWSTNTTNCITEIPQDINLELSSGTLTLKAGSKVYMPNGSGVFDVVTNSNDLTYTLTANGEHLICVAYNAGAITSRPVSSCTSGAGATAVSGFAYNTTTNKINNFSGTGTIGGQYSFPIAIITVSNGAISSIDQVFNGFGYIGSTIFVLPSVSFLVPNGKNADGTQNSVLRTTSSVITRNDMGASRTNYYAAMNQGLFINYSSSYSVKEDGYLYAGTTKRTDCVFATYSTDSNGNITSFDPKVAFIAVDMNDAVLNYGDQTIAGVKTHTDDITIEKSGTGGRYNIKNTSLDLTNTSRTNSIGIGTRLFDKNDNIAGEFAGYYDTSGTSKTQIQVRNRASGSEVSAHISINVDKDGNVYTYAPTPTDTTSTSATKIATTGWANKTGNNIVHRTDNETVGGIKTFSTTNGIATSVSGSNNILQNNTAVDITNTSRASAYTNAFSVNDKNGLVAGHFGTTFRTDGGVRSYMQARNKATGSQVTGEINVTVDKNGNVSTYAPTPSSATDHSTKIATTQWFRDALTSLCPTIRMTKKEDISSSGLPYTATADGIIRVKIGATYDWQLKINGTVVQEQARNNSDSCVTTWVCIPVKTGDILTATGSTCHFDGGALYYPY